MAKAGDKVIITGSPIVVPDISQLMGNNIVKRDASDGRGAGKKEFIACSI